MGNRYSRYLAVSTAWVVAVSAVCYFGGLRTASAAGQAQERAAFNSGQVRLPEDPAKVIHGKALYGINCQACHGQDLRGGDMGGPNLLRSQAALTDQHGELITPIIQGSRMSQGMPNIGLNDEDAGAVAAYIRSVIGTIGSQGTPPGEKAKPKLDIVVGDVTRGEEYFAAHCASCHSATGDLKGIATKYAEPAQLQAVWVAGGARNRNTPKKATVDVAVAPGKKISGELVRIDDFLVTLKQSDGTQRSFARKGAVPVVVVHDRTQAHRDMLPNYTDHDIHDVTAYLVTLK